MDGNDQPGSRKLDETHDIVGSERQPRNERDQVVWRHGAPFYRQKKYKGLFMPGYEAWDSVYQPASTGLLYVDHCVGNVGWNQMNRWVSFYEKVMGFKNILSFDDSDISTEYSALMSKVMSNGNGQVKFPINEPAEGKKKSQVEEFLEFFNGEGVQHVAMATKIS
jgi:4-hydroxyphenylpyruvate dioxygenase